MLPHLHLRPLAFDFDNFFLLTFVFFWLPLANYFAVVFSDNVFANWDNVVFCTQRCQKKKPTEFKKK